MYIQKQIELFQADALTELPIMITNQVMDIEAALEQEAPMGPLANLEFVDTDYATLFNPKDETLIHKNTLNKEFVDYVSAMNPDYASSIGYTYIYRDNRGALDWY